MSTSVQEQKQLQLYGEQVYMVWLARGTMLVVESGGMRLTQLMRLSCIALPAEEIVLREGECHIVERSGWLCLRRADYYGSTSDQAHMTHIRQIDIQATPARGSHFLRRIALLLGSIRLGTTR